MSMFNPNFVKVTNMCENIAKAHVGELEFMQLTWKELLDANGNVYQIVPLLDVTFKG